MATSRVMTSRYFRHFDQNSLIFILSLGEIFSYFATSWKWHCLTFWTGKKSRLFRRFFQYSVICHYSQCMRLALTDFNKNRVFHRNCMWLQLSQEKISIYFLTWRHKNQKNTRGSRVDIPLGARSGDAMYHMRESKSKLELFYRLFIEFFVIFFFGPRAKHVWMEFGSLEFFWDSIARATIACQTSVLIARSQMTQVTLRRKEITSALERR